MKTIFHTALILLFTLNILYGVDEKRISDIFEEYESSVVYIEQALFFNENDFKYANMFRDIEKKYNIEILNSYKTIVSGSGFFITKDGYIVTNNHVIDVTNLKENKKRMLDAIVYDLLSRVDKEEASNYYSRVYEDFKKLIEKSEFTFRIIVNNKDSYTVPSFYRTNRNLDIAILKIDGNNFMPIPIGSQHNLKVGNTVIAIGYPMPALMSSFLKDFKSTTTVGTVSSIRNDIWGIQHTASINLGNSGGPLIDTDGEVVGINVGVNRRAQDIYFSISVDKLIEWLKDSGEEKIISKNKETKSKFRTKYIITGDILETGPNLFIEYEEEAKIYIDDELIGETPFLIKGMEEGEHNLKIEADEGYDSKKIIIKKNIKEVLTYSPEMLKYGQQVIINSDPEYSDVFLDEDKMGITPLRLDNVESGIHKIRIHHEGYVDYEEEMMVMKEKPFEKTFILERGYLIFFKNELPNDTIIEATKNDKLIKFSPGERILFEKGKWQIKITSNDLENSDTIVEIDIKDRDIEIDFMPEYKKAMIVFKGLRRGSRVLLDGIDITEEIIDNKYEAEVGRREIKIFLKGYEPIILDTYVDDNDNNVFNVKYKIDMDSFKKSLKPM